MKAALDIGCDDGIWAELRIVNDGEQAALIHNPGDDRPTQGWEFSREAYRIAVLRSFHFLQMTVRGEDGALLEPFGISTRANHEVGLPIELEPRAELILRIPLHEFYELERGSGYSLALTYGDDNARVSAAARFRCS